MKPTRIFSLCSLLLATAVLPLANAGAEESKPTASASGAKLDFGDFTSSVITTHAWKALEAKKHDEVVGYTGKCIELYKTKALEMQKSLTAPASSDKAHDYWALNDVGTCYFILAKSLEVADKKKEALEAYKYLAENLSFAQCWDTKGWFWKPGEAAKERLKVLEFDSLK